MNTITLIDDDNLIKHFDFPNKESDFNTTQAGHAAIAAKAAVALKQTSPNVLTRKQNGEFITPLRRVGGKQNFDN